MAEKARAMHPYSRPHVVQKLDRRTKVARRFEQIVGDLTAHAGGDSASITSRILIERIATDLLQLEQLDQKFTAAAAGNGTWTDHDARTAGGLRGSIRLGLKQIGINATTSKPAGPDPYGRRAMSVADLVTR